MGANVEALKNLFVALGGDADDVADVTLISDMINAIATVAAGVSAATLPQVESPADDGKILKVVDGKWEAAES